MIYRTNVVCHSRNVRPSSPKSLSNENSVFLPIIMKPLSYSWSNTTLEAKLIPETKSTHFLIICPLRAAHLPFHSEAIPPALSKTLPMGADSQPNHLPSDTIHTFSPILSFPA